MMTDRSVLLVDPDSDLRHATAAALERAGFCVVEAGDRDGAFRAYLAAKPAAVLLSLDAATEAEQLQLCRQLRALPGADYLVIVLLAGNTDDDASFERGFAAGATDCLARPVNYVLLRHRLEQMLTAQSTGIALERSQRSLLTAQRAAGLGDFRLDVVAGEVSWSAEVSRLLRLPPAAPRSAAAGRFLAFVHPEDRPFVSAAFERAVEDGAPFSFETRVICDDDCLRTVRLTGRCEARPLSTAIDLHGSMLDITDRRSQQEQLRYLAYYDQVTRLPNRARLEGAIGRLVSSHVSRGARRFALISIALDNYLRATESLGRDCLDDLLRTLAERLESAVRCRRRGEGGERLALAEHAAGRRRHKDLVARIGGYEFAVLLEDVEDAAAAEHIGLRLCRRLAEPCLIDGRRLYLSASAGVAIYPADGADANALMRAADAALADAARSGGGCCQRFVQRMNDTIRQRSGRELALRNALEKNRFVLHYQPRVDLRGNRVMGAEALLRMRSEDDGSLIPPAEFIPLAEELGLIVEMGRTVITRALRQLRSWQSVGLVDRRFVMSVNISPRQFADPHLFEHIEASLRNERIPPTCLELEITEGTLIRDLELTSRLLEARRELGIRVAIDDYGTGYSSLAYLRGLPVDTLKIDRCFINGLGDNQADEVIVRFTIQLAHHLNLAVCAEGVETQVQLDYLRSLQCDQVQGHHFGRPMSAEEMTSRLVPPHLRDVGGPAQLRAGRGRVRRDPSGDGGLEPAGPAAVGGAGLIALGGDPQSESDGAEPDTDGSSPIVLRTHEELERTGNVASHGREAQGQKGAQRALRTHPAEEPDA